MWHVIISGRAGWCSFIAFFSAHRTRFNHVAATFSQHRVHPPTPNNKINHRAHVFRASVCFCHIGARFEHSEIGIESVDVV